jgi:hypothetical protein
VPVFAFGQTPHYSYARPLIDFPKKTVPSTAHPMSRWVAFFGAVSTVYSCGALPCRAPPLPTSACFVPTALCGMPRAGTTLEKSRFDNRGQERLAVLPRCCVMLIPNTRGRCSQVANQTASLAAACHAWHARLPLPALHHPSLQPATGVPTSVLMSCTVDYAKQLGCPCLTFCLLAACRLARQIGYLPLLAWGWMGTALPKRVSSCLIKAGISLDNSIQKLPATCTNC